MITANTALSPAEIAAHNEAWLARHVDHMEPSPPEALHWLYPRVAHLVIESPSLRWLDIACGLGCFARLLPAEHAYTGVDVSEAALGRARAAHPTRTFVHGRAQRLPFPDAAFDRAVCLNALHEIPSAHLAPATAEIARVLAPGGKGFALWMCGNEEGYFKPCWADGPWWFNLHAVGGVAAAFAQAGLAVEDVESDGSYAWMWIEKPAAT